MRVRCPQCQETVEVIEDSDFSEIECPSCESSFSLLGEETHAWEPPEIRALGHFELTEKLGAGAFGTVWMAHDTQLDRTVAIKLPRKGQLTAREAEMFLREARAAAQLRHPGIVPVHEVGREDGDVYIVSDYVEGLTLADWMVGQQPSVDQAAELTIRMARALDHAHLAGVVHRDFKSTNVMVDRDGQPHVMDFGLAKREAGDLTVTMDGQILGTPSYMSPEQARGEAHRADRRSDIYSLGVVFYELLTGHRPFRGNARMLLQQVIEDDPPNPRKLNSNVPRDLETMCLRCLRKDPAKRYQTAAELADDLERWQRKEPIHARPVGPFERVVRWCQRRPAVAGLIALAVTLTVAGFGGISWQLRRTQIARTQANDNLQEAQRQQRQAENNLRQAIRAVEQMLTRVGSEKLSNVPLMEGVRRELLEDALTFYLDFLEERKDDPLLRAETAAAHLRVGEINRLLGQNARAEQAFLESSRLFRRLIEDFPDEPKYRADLGLCAFERGILLSNLGRSSESEESFKLARDLYERLHAEFPENTDYQAKLSRSCNAVGIMWRFKRPADAELQVRRGIALRVDLQNKGDHTPTNTHRLAQMHIALGGLLITLQGREAGEPEYAKAERLMRELMQREPHLPAYRKTLINAHTGLGRANRQRDPEQAEVHYRTALRLQSELSDAFPQVVQHRADLGSNYYNLALLLKSLKRNDEAAQAYRTSAEIREKLTVEFPESREYKRALARTYGNYSRLPSLSTEEAMEVATRAVQTAKALFEAYPDDALSAQGLAQAHTRLGRIIARSDPVRGEQEYAHAIRLHEQLIEKAADNPEPRYQLVRTRHSVAWGLAGSTEPARAVRHYETAIAELESLLAEHRDRSSFREELAELCHNYAWLKATASDPDLADPAHAQRLVQKSLEVDPDNGTYQTTLGTAKYFAGDWQGAVDALERSLELEPTSADSHWLLAMSHWKLGDPESARKSLQKGLAIEGAPGRYREAAITMIQPAVSEDPPADPGDDPC